MPSAPCWLSLRILMEPMCEPQGLEGREEMDTRTLDRCWAILIGKESPEPMELMFD